MAQSSLTAGDDEEAHAAEDEMGEEALTARGEVQVIPLAPSPLGLRTITRLTRFTAAKQKSTATGDPAETRQEPETTETRQEPERKTRRAYGYGRRAVIS